MIHGSHAPRTPHNTCAGGCGILYAVSGSTFVIRCICLMPHSLPQQHICTSLSQSEWKRLRYQLQPYTHTLFTRHLELRVYRDTVSLIWHLWSTFKQDISPTWCRYLIFLKTEEPGMDQRTSPSINEEQAFLLYPFPDPRRRQIRITCLYIRIPHAPLLFPCL